jgi:hypothetical protein
MEVVLTRCLAESEKESKMKGYLKFSAFLSFIAVLSVLISVLLNKDKEK